MYKQFFYTEMNMSHWKIQKFKNFRIQILFREFQENSGKKILIFRAF